MTFRSTAAALALTFISSANAAQAKPDAGPVIDFGFCNTPSAQIAFKNGKKLYEEFLRTGHPVGTLSVTQYSPTEFISRQSISKDQVIVAKYTCTPRT